jgi:hypothetical protein
VGGGGSAGGNATVTPINGAANATSGLPQIRERAGSFIIERSRELRLVVVEEETADDHDKDSTRTKLTKQQDKEPQ